MVFSLGQLMYPAGFVFSAAISALERHWEVKTSIDRQQETRRLEYEYRLKELEDNYRQRLEEQRIVEKVRFEYQVQAAAINRRAQREDTQTPFVDSLERAYTVLKRQFETGGRKPIVLTAPFYDDGLSRNDNIAGGRTVDFHLAVVGALMRAPWGNTFLRKDGYLERPLIFSQRDVDLIAETLADIPVILVYGTVQGAFSAEKMLKKIQPSIAFWNFLPGQRGEVCHVDLDFLVADIPLDKSSKGLAEYSSNLQETVGNYLARFVGMLGEAYHLIHTEKRPSLCQFKLKDSDELETLALTMSSLFDQICKSKPAQAPFYRLDQALMFAECELPQLSTQSLNQSFETWIQNQRQADRVEKNLNALLKFIESGQVIEGSKYVEKLRDYFTAIKDEQGVKKANTTLEVLKESIMAPQVEEVIGFDLGHGSKERKDMASQANRLESLRSIREDLHSKLDSIRDQLKDMNISEDERSQIIDDFHTLDAILEALEKQHIRIAICGKVNAGKSSLANSLLQADVYKTDALQGTAVKTNGSIKLDKWEIYDTPGIMSNLADDEEAKENIRRAHVRIFVINDQPYEPELELFRWATQLMPGLPTVVFFNKYDEFQERRQPRADKERILEAVKSRMQPFVKNVETDIIFGSASLFDPDSESFKRQPPPKDLMDWLYNKADYSSTLINVLDPAKRALTNIESNVLRVREQVARRILIEYAEGNATSALIPFSSVTLFPARLHRMNLTICEIMGVPPEKMQSAESISKVFWEGIWAAATTEALWSVAGLVLAPYTFGVSLMVTAYGTYREWDESQKRVLVLGEALIQWIKSGYPNIRDAKAYLDQIRKKIESGDL